MDVDRAVFSAMCGHGRAAVADDPELAGIETCYSRLPELAGTEPLSRTEPLLKRLAGELLEPEEAETLSDTTFSLELEGTSTFTV